MNRLSVSLLLLRIFHAIHAKIIYLHTCNLGVKPKFMYSRLLASYGVNLFCQKGTLKFYTNEKSIS